MDAPSTDDDAEACINALAERSGIDPSSPMGTAFSMALRSSFDYGRISRFLGGLYDTPGLDAEGRALIDDVDRHALAFCVLAERRKREAAND